MKDRDPLGYGLISLGFARNVMKRSVLDSRVQRQLRYRKSLRTKYTTPLGSRPLVVRQEPLFRRFPISERLPSDQNLVLAAGSNVAEPAEISRRADSVQRDGIPSERLALPQRSVREEEVPSPLPRVATVRESLRRVAASTGRENRDVPSERLSVSRPPASRELSTKQEDADMVGPKLRRVSQLDEEPGKRTSAKLERDGQSTGVSILPRQEGVWGSMTGENGADLEEVSPLGDGEDSENAVAPSAEQLTESTLPVSSQPDTQKIQKAEPSSVQPRKTSSAEAHKEVSPSEGIQATADALGPLDEKADSASVEGERIQKSSPEIAKRAPESRIAGDADDLLVAADERIDVPPEGLVSTAEMGEVGEGRTEVYTALQTTMYGGNLLGTEPHPTDSPAILSRRPEDATILGRSEENLPSAASNADVALGDGEGAVPDAGSDSDAGMRGDRAPGTVYVRESSAREPSPEEPVDAISQSLEPDVEGEDASQGSPELEADNGRTDSETVVPRAYSGEERGVESASQKIQPSSEQVDIISVEDSINREIAHQDDVGERGQNDGQQLESVPLQSVPLQKVLFKSVEDSTDTRISYEVDDTPESLTLGRSQARGVRRKKADAAITFVRRASSDEGSAQRPSDTEALQTESSEVEDMHEELDLDELTDKVYGRIRERLRVERERYGSSSHW